MNLTRIITLLICVVLLGQGIARGQDKDAVREKLDTAIVEGIRLLEAKEYATFLKNFADPEQLKKVTESGKIDEFAQKFGEGKAKQLILVLKAIKGAAPKMSEDGKTATFDISVEGVNKKTIGFTKVGKYWYISN